MSLKTDTFGSVDLFHLLQSSVFFPADLHVITVSYSNVEVCRRNHWAQWGGHSRSILLEVLVLYDSSWIRWNPLKIWEFHISYAVQISQKTLYPKYTTQPYYRQSLQHLSLLTINSGPHRLIVSFSPTFSQSLKTQGNAKYPSILLTLSSIQSSPLFFSTWDQKINIVEVGKLLVNKQLSYS